jgi:rare lipoprotein A
VASRRSIANSAALCALACAALTLAGCAHKRRRIVQTPSPPQIINGETGLASWYGHPYDGRAAADGEIYHMEEFTAAHRTLPFGTWVRVVNLTNNKTVDVRITDRGPFVDGRIIDLSHAAAQAIGLIGPGVAPVRLDILSAPNIAPAQNWFGVQAGAFLDQSRAERLRVRLEREYGAAQLVYRPGRPPMWRVLAGRLPSESAAAEIAQRIRQQVGDAFVVRLDSPVSTPTRAVGPAVADPEP